MDPQDLRAPSSMPLLVRGVAGILFGVLALFLPGAALASLVLLFAAYMLVDGVFALIAAVRAARAHDHWVWFALEGIADLAAGLVAVFVPALTVVAFMVLLAAWGCVSGVLLIIAAFSARVPHGRWWMGLAGLVSLAWGVLLFAWPGAGAIAIVLWLGAYALVFGIALVVTSVRMRREQRLPRQRPA